MVIRVSHLTGGKFGGLIRGMNCENNKKKKKKFWTELTNSMSFITDMAPDALTVQTSWFFFFFLLFMGKSIENKQINNAQATRQINLNLHLGTLRDHPK